jgi:hypothetical protein
VSRSRVDVVALTSQYEEWLAAQIPVVGPDLARKHELMAASTLRFLRATYYLWLVRMEELLPELMRAPAVPAVGDIHAENFGTWRDRDGRRRWGVNDFDELAPASFAIDLVRLATSVALIGDQPLTPRQLARTILRHWHTAADQPAVRLSSGAADPVRTLLPDADPDAHFYPALAATVPATGVPDPVAAAVRATGPDGWRPTWHVRTAGVGSLGHPRMVAVGPGPDGRWLAREAKLLGPPTAAWLGRPVDDGLYPRVTAVLRGPSPGDRLDGWQVRRLAPDVLRVAVGGQSERGMRRVLALMARAVGGVHAVDPKALVAARKASEKLGRNWLEEAVEVMAADTRECHRAWHRSDPQ